MEHAVLSPSKMFRYARPNDSEGTKEHPLCSTGTRDVMDVCDARMLPH